MYVGIHVCVQLMSWSSCDGLVFSMLRAKTLDVNNFGTSYWFHNTLFHTF